VTRACACSWEHPKRGAPPIFRTSLSLTTPCTAYNDPNMSPALSMPSLHTPVLWSPVWLLHSPLQTCLCPLDTPQPQSLFWPSSASNSCASVRHAPLRCSPNSHLLDDTLQSSLCSLLNDLWHLRTALTLDLPLLPEFPSPPFALDHALLQLQCYTTGTSMLGACPESTPLCHEPRCDMQLQTQHCLPGA
jgi:hypothetical protein